MELESGFNKNPLVGRTQKDTLENMLEVLDYLQINSEDQHAGVGFNLSLIRDALGYTLQQEARASGVSVQPEGQH